MLHNTYVDIFTKYPIIWLFLCVWESVPFFLYSRFGLLSLYASHSIYSILHRYHNHYCSIGLLNERLFDGWICVSMRIRYKLWPHQCCNRNSKARHTLILDNRHCFPWKTRQHTHTTHIFGHERARLFSKIEVSESEKSWSDRVKMNKIYGRLNQMPLSMHTMGIRTITTGHNFSLVWRINSEWALAHSPPYINDNSSANNFWCGFSH